MGTVNGLGIDRTDTESGATILTLLGQLEFSNAPDFREFAAGLCDGRAIIMDLSQTKFVDSTGVGALMGAGRRAQKQGGKVCLVLGDNHRIEKVLRITGLTKVFPTFADVESALAADA